MKIYKKKQETPSLQILQSQDQIQKLTFEQYDEEPTIIYSGYNRESINSPNSRYNNRFNNNFKRNSKLKTYQSNLMDSSPERSQKSLVDGEFVCKYLTPIKKQQINQLLFKDQINQNLHNQKTKNIKQNNNQKQLKIKNQYSKNEPNRLYDNLKHNKTQNMIKSFHQSNLINKIHPKISNQNTQAYGQLKQKGRSSSMKMSPSIFIDSQAQVYFLKSNNNQLYKKLQAQIEKSKRFQQKIKQLEADNKKLSQKNITQQITINNFKQMILKLQEEKRKYLQKQWQQFKFVKQLLILKNNSKSKNKRLIQNSTERIKKPSFNQSLTQNNFYVKTQNQKTIQPNKINYKKRIPTQQKDEYILQNQSIDKLCIEIKNNFKSYLNYQNKNPTLHIKKNLSNQNLTSSSKKHPINGQNNQGLNKILQNKLLLSNNIQKSYKKSLQSSPSRKTFKKNGSMKKQNVESFSKQTKRNQLKQNNIAFG